jgi:hypothetical protein
MRKYVWAAKDFPDVGSTGIKRGDHLLVNEVKEANHVLFEYTCDEGHTWALYLDDVYEARWEGFLAGNGPVVLGFTVVAFAVIYLGWHIALWMT